MMLSKPRTSAAANSLPDLDGASAGTPNTPSTWQEDEDLLNTSLEEILEKASSDDIWSHAQSERRRSSGIAVQQLLSQIDGLVGAPNFTTYSAAAFDDHHLAPAPSWKVVIETSFASRYLRNDRKNIQCFPTCTLAAQDDPTTGHGKSSMWCRGVVNARAFAIDPEINVADISMFEAVGVFVMTSENPRTKPLSELIDVMRASLRRVDGRSLEIKVAPTVWKFEPNLSKKKSEEARNQCSFVVIVTFKGLEVGRCISAPFDLASQKADIRREKKRAMVDDGGWGPKHLVLDTFAQASNWAIQAIGLSSPKTNQRKSQNGKVTEPEEKADSIEIIDDPAGVAAKKESTLSVTSSRSATSSVARYPLLAGGMSSRSINAPDKQSINVGLIYHQGSDIEQGIQPHQPQDIVTASVVVAPKQVEHKRISIALLLWLPPFGFLGAHHAYLGRAQYALNSALTLNMLLLGWIMDAVRLPMLVYWVNFPGSSKGQLNDMTESEYFLVWLLFGLVGGHRYVVGDWKLGIFYTLTLAGLGTLWVNDLFQLGKLRSRST